MKRTAFTLLIGLFLFTGVAAPKKPLDHTAIIADGLSSVVHPA